MLEGGSSNREVQCILFVLIIGKTVDYAGREAVSTAYAVDDIGDFIVTRKIETCFAVEGCRPSVVVCALGLTKCNRNLLYIRKLLLDLVGQNPVGLFVQLAGSYISSSP